MWCYSVTTDQRLGTFGEKASLSWVKEKTRTFLLCQDEVTREDGTFTIHSPFMITPPNRLDAFVAFPTQELAEFFKKTLKSEGGYRSVDVGIVEKRKLNGSRYLYMFWTQGIFSGSLAKK